MTKKPARVPPMITPHQWVLLGAWRIELGEHEAKRISEHPEDIAVSFQERAKVAGPVSGPGCEVCGGHVRDVAGQSCPGERGLTERAVAMTDERKAAETRSKIWTPGGPPSHP